MKTLSTFINEKLNLSDYKNPAVAIKTPQDKNIIEVIKTELMNSKYLDGNELDIDKFLNNKNFQKTIEVIDQVVSISKTAPLSEKIFLLCAIAKWCDDNKKDDNEQMFFEEIISSITDESSFNDETFLRGQYTVFLKYYYKSIKDIYKVNVNNWF